MALWFECKVRYDKMQENGMVKKVNEPYLVDALTFTEAESRIVEEMKPFISGEYSISSEKKTSTLILVQAADFDSALSNFKEGMKGTMADYEIASITETMLMDVFPAKLENN